jgi:hypothetical protein
MRMDLLFGLIGVILVVGLSSGVLWLATSPMQPPPQQTHLVLPDERIPH